MTTDIAFWQTGLGNLEGWPRTVRSSKVFNDLPGNSTGKVLPSASNAPLAGPVTLGNATEIVNSLEPLE
jgi:hypothetical protein